MDLKYRCYVKSIAISNDYKYLAAHCNSNI
jgi:hypothetical protein